MRRWGRLCLPILSFLCFNLVDEGNCNKLCRSYKDCVGQAITDSQLIDCTGYFSCTNASSIYTVGGRLWCAASFSCYQAQSIDVTNDQQVIGCFGSFSCANVNRIQHSHGDIQCFGEHACSESTIIVADEKSLSCTALRSCSSSDITINPQFGIDGTLATQNAILRANNASVSFQFGASDASNGATIICTHSCQIHCNSGTACNNLTLTCADDFDSCNFTIYCDNALQSDICTDGLTLPSLYQLPSLRDIEFSTRDGASKTCLQDVSTNCQDDGVLGILDGTCSDLSDDSDEVYSPIVGSNGVCCSASGGCYETGGINASLAIGADSTGDEVAIRADAYQSFELLYGPIQALNGGHMFFTAYQTIPQDVPQFIEGNGMYDLIASGDDAIQSNIVRNVRHLYCLASEACRDVNVSNVFGDVYAYAELSVKGATVSDVTGNIYCDGTEACKEFVVDAVGGDIISVGYGIMSQTQINNVEGVLIAYGEQALSGAVVRQVNMVAVGGNDALNAATIVSEVGGEFRLIIDGDNSLSFDVYCNATDTCLISCTSSESCDLLNLHCEGQCYVLCNDDAGRTCPAQSLPNNWQKLQTEEPTMLPSFEPTVMPSAGPTMLPTVTPTELTNEPSDAPVPIASNSPTETPTSRPSAAPTEVISSQTSNGSGEVGSTDAGLVAGIFVGVVLLLIIICVVARNARNAKQKRNRDKLKQSLSGARNSQLPLAGFGSTHQLGTPNMERLGTHEVDDRDEELPEDTLTPTRDGALRTGTMSSMRSPESQMSSILGIGTLSPQLSLPDANTVETNIHGNVKLSMPSMSPQTSADMDLHEGNFMP